MSGPTELDVQIEKLRKGDTLSENEVKVLCEKVRKSNCHSVPGELLELGIFTQCAFKGHVDIVP